MHRVCVAQVVSNVDFAPTLIELATGSAPAAGAPHDGRSFLAPVDLDRTLFAEEEKDRNVVTQRFKLTAIALEQVGTVGHGCKAAPQRFKAGYPHSADSRQLYDLEADPTEQINRYDDDALAGVRAELEAALACHLHNTRIGGHARFTTCSARVNPSPPPPPALAAGMVGVVVGVAISLIAVASWRVHVRRRSQRQPGSVPNPARRPSAATLGTRGLLGRSGALPAEWAQSGGSLGGPEPKVQHEQQAPVVATSAIKAVELSSPVAGEERGVVVLD